MQCEIRALSERRENGRKRVSDTLPKPGRVNEVCKEWLVHEDGALAYQLQQKEVQEHYSGNRSRNAIVREDFPKALDEQKREEEEAMARYLEMTRLQEERDARLAKEFAQRITLEEEEKQRRRLHEDEAIANQIQEKELQRTKDGKVRHLTAAAGSSQLGAAAAAVGDVNSVGLPLPAQLPPPLPPPSSSAHAHKSHHHQHLQQLTKQFRATNV
ncbi:hypothetical protein LSTR_LSTR011481 [Laodelphax striatellus]|uniref:Coiled-coil domain-containing protein n=1 Tax=Laodelphax striatellus TaxID=195883 RepID=A0A482WN86_LAOST|nr:hypothetical protein LSTR_LSTR011481 [Laodelphax striatellus]